MKIDDGTGKGYQAKVDSNNRTHVDSVSRSQSEQAALQSNSYNINTGAITLTSANESGVFYLKNTGSNPLVIKEIIVILGSSTGGTGAGTVEILKNPTAGTLISGATDVTTNENRDFGSVKVITGLAYKGAEGNTVTDGSVFSSTSRTDFSAPVTFDASVIILRRGNSLAVTYTPPTSNTSQNIIVACTVFEEASDI